MFRKNWLRYELLWQVDALTFARRQRELALDKQAAAQVQVEQALAQVKRAEEQAAMAIEDLRKARESGNEEKVEKAEEKVETAKKEVKEAEEKVEKAKKEVKEAEEKVEKAEEKVEKAKKEVKEAEEKVEKAKKEVKEAEEKAIRCAASVHSYPERCRGTSHIFKWFTFFGSIGSVSSVNTFSMPPKDEWTPNHKVNSRMVHRTESTRESPTLNRLNIQTDSRRCQLSLAPGGPRLLSLARWSGKASWNAAFWRCAAEWQKGHLFFSVFVHCRLGQGPVQRGTGPAKDQFEGTASRSWAGSATYCGDVAGKVKQNCLANVRQTRLSRQPS